jgi:hypothetical protein
VLRPPESIKKAGPLYEAIAALPFSYKTTLYKSHRKACQQLVSSGIRKTILDAGKKRLSE